MLKNLNGKIYNQAPHQSTLNALKRNLTNKELDAIIKELNHIISSSQGIETSSYIPGSDWTGTVYQPIYEKGADYSFDLAAKMFGILLFEVFINRSETWLFCKSENIRGTVYFK